MKLYLIKGDTYVLTFTLVDNDGNPYILTENDKCYFTVKKRFECEDYIFQKQWLDGISYNATTKKYEIQIAQNDTCDLPIGTYVYDIKVKIGTEIVKTLALGELTIENNATHKGNE